jgi:hypothetical protein
VKAKELERLFIKWRKGSSKENIAAWRCYGLNTPENEYRWENRQAFINFVRGYELAKKEAENGITT